MRSRPLEEEHSHAVRRVVRAGWRCRVGKDRWEFEGDGELQGLLMALQRVAGSWLLQDRWVVLSKPLGLWGAT